MVDLGDVAADVGIEAFKTVDQPLLKEKIQSSVYGRRLGPAVPAAQGLENMVGALGFMSGPNYFKNVEPKVGQAHPAFLANSCCFVKRPVHTYPVIMIAYWKGSATAPPVFYRPLSILIEPVLSEPLAEIAIQ